MGMAAEKHNPRTELLQIQKRIFHRNDRLIRSEAMVVEPGFRAYERRYRKAVDGFERPAEIEEVISAIEDADIIYFGDYHTNPQAQRALLRVLKLVVGRVTDIGLGVELVRDAQQSTLDRFMAEKISEATFLRKIGFKEYWYFDLWNNFRPIFDFTRHHKIAVYGIESEEAVDKGLRVRDQKSAECIADILEKNEGQKLFIFIGDLHIAPQHLPQAVDRELKKRDLKKERLILYQNSEAIYWQLADRQMEETVEMVKVDEESFCFMNTPPIVWQQTYLNWLEHEGETIDYADAKLTVLELLERIADFLDLPLPKDIDEVEVFTCGDLSILESVEENGDFSARELKTIKRQILSSESYFIPSMRYIYLANVSINHAAEEATHYLKYLCAGEEFARPSVDAFYVNALHEALGFFGSKIINHKRKCLHEAGYEDLANYLKSGRPSAAQRLQLEIAHLVLDHKKLEKRGKPIHPERIQYHKADIFLGVTHALGYMLGDRLYHALVSGKITKKRIQDLFYHRMEDEGEPFKIYLDLVRKTRNVKMPRRI